LIYLHSTADIFCMPACCYRYEEQYLMALNGWKEAKQLDPAWAEPSIKTKELINYLETVSELVLKRGKLKSKRLNKLIESIKDTDLGKTKVCTTSNSVFFAGVSDALDFEETLFSASLEE